MTVLGCATGFRPNGYVYIAMPLTDTLPVNSLRRGEGTEAGPGMEYKRDPLTFTASLMRLFYDGWMMYGRNKLDEKEREDN